MSPIIVPVGFVLAVVLGYLSGVFNGEGVIDRQDRLAKEAKLKWLERMGAEESIDTTFGVDND